MTQAPEREPTIADVLERIDKLSKDVEESNEKFDVYRQANQSLVNLAFGLIASATVATVASIIFRR